VQGELVLEYPWDDNSATLTLEARPVDGAEWTHFRSGTEVCTSTTGKAVLMEITTANGAISDTIEGRAGVDEEGVLHFEAQLDLGALQGKLNALTVAPEGATRLLGRFSASQASDGLTARLTVIAEYPEADGNVVRAQYLDLASWAQ
jgi:hypothetical protein